MLTTFLCPCWPFVCLLLASIGKSLIFFFLIEFLSCIIDGDEFFIHSRYNLCVRYMHYNYFLPVCSLPFIFLMCILINRRFSFWWIPIYLFFSLSLLCFILFVSLWSLSTPQIRKIFSYVFFQIFHSFNTYI